MRIAIVDDLSTDAEALRKFLCRWASEQGIPLVPSPVILESGEALLLAYPYFCDCMRGVLVNLEQVESLTARHFLLSDGTSVPVSRLKYKEVREKYLSFAYARMRGGFTNGTL